MRILIIGGAGYIGSHVAHRYKQTGHDVAIFDNFSTGHMSLAKNSGADFITDVDCCLLQPNYINCDQIVYLGALSIIPESITHPVDYYDNNICSAVNLIDCMVKSNCRKIIFSSSAAVYGNPAYSPIDEHHTTDPINPYGRTKLAIEWLLQDSAKAYDIKFVSLRYFNAAGASCVADLGELHSPETHVIPLMIQASLQSKTFNIFGDTYSTTDGFAVRDYVHVEDIAEAHLLASKYLESGGSSITVNVGSGGGLSVYKVLLAFQSFLKSINAPCLTWDIMPKRPGDPPELVADCHKAKSLLNWEPKKSMDDILSSAYKWHSKIKDLKINDIKKNI